jgi:hypothetical protein
LVPGGDYLFWIKNNAFELLFDLRNPVAGPKGDPGEDGEDGEDGADGAQGPQGPQGPAGTSITALLPADTSIAPYTGNADVISTGGFATYADAGGKMWKRGSTTAPAVPAFFKKQAFDGHWYEAISKRNLFGEDLGILTTGVDYSGVINEALTWLNSKGGGKITLPPFSITCNNDLIFDGDGLALTGTTIGNTNSVAGTTLFMGTNRTVRIGSDAASGAPDRRNIEFSNLHCRSAAGSTAYFFTSKAIRNLSFRSLSFNGIFGFHYAGDTTAVGLTHPNFTRNVGYDDIEGNLSTSTSLHFITGPNLGNFSIRNVHAEGANPPKANSAGIHFPSGASNRPDGSWIINSGFHYFDQGINVENGLANTFISNTFFDGVNTGVRFVPDATIGGIRFSNCHFAAFQPPSASQIGILLAESASSGDIYRVSFDNCQIIHFGKQGLNIQDPNFNISITGCQFEDNCAAAANESVVLISPAVNDFQFSNNQIYKKINSGTFVGKPKYGINVLSTQPRLSIVNNQIEPNDLLPAASGGKAINNPNRGPAHVRRVHNNTTQVFEGQVVVIGPWAVLNLPAGTAAATAAFLSGLTTVTAALVQRRGKVISIAARSNRAITSGANSLVFHVYRDGSPMTPNFDAPSIVGTTTEIFNEDIDGHDFEAGNTIGVYYNTNSLIYSGGTTADWNIYLSVYYD